VPGYEAERLREIFVASYRLVYRVSDDSVELVALIHGRRDLTSVLRGRTGAP
jgi:plasmid stabilization system protein ParE